MTIQGTNNARHLDLFYLQVQQVESTILVQVQVQVPFTKRQT